MNYALNTVVLNGHKTTLAGGDVLISISGQGSSGGIAGVASAVLSINASGNLIQMPPGGMALLRITSSANGIVAGRGDVIGRIVIGASGDLTEAIRDHGYVRTTIQSQGTLKKTRLQNGHGIGVLVLHARSRATVWHVKRNKGQASITLTATTAITASIPEIAMATHKSRAIMVPVERRVMVVPPEKERGRAHAAYSYVR